MKALSIEPIYATAITLGWKWIELRTWAREYRGWVLISASKAINKFERESLVSGHAVCIAHLTDIRPYDDENDRELAFLCDDHILGNLTRLFRLCLFRSRVSKSYSMRPLNLMT